MSNRERAIVSRVIESRMGMSHEEVRDGISTLVLSLSQIVEEIEDGDFTSIGDISKQSNNLERVVLSLDDEMVSREVDNVRMELMRLLNDIEAERRRYEDEDRSRGQRALALIRKVNVMRSKFNDVGGIL